MFADELQNSALSETLYDLFQASPADTVIEALVEAAGRMRNSRPFLDLAEAIRPLTDDPGEDEEPVVISPDERI